MSAQPSLHAATGPRILFAELGAGLPAPHITIAAPALTSAFPLALSGPSLAYARNADNVTWLKPLRAVSSRDQSGLWLRNAAAGLCVLAAAAAAVSFTAHYQMVDATRHLAAVGASVFMNAIAAGPGWRNLAIWVMPPAAYALASDTLIGVVRAWALARHHHLTDLATETATPLAVPGGVVLWLLRRALAPASTLAGFRACVLTECPVAPGRRAPGPRPAAAPHPRKATKTARFLDLVTERHGSFASIPLDAVARISARLAPDAGLNAGAARTALRKAVLAARNGGPR